MIKMPLGYRKGQVLVLGLALIAIVIISFLGMYRNSQIISKRTKLTHVVDSAAYAGAIVQARALNMQAYINLAQTANQIALAHLITQSSWTQWGQNMGKQVTKRNPQAELIKRFFGSKYSRAYLKGKRAQLGASSHIADLKNQFESHQKIINEVLFETSKAIHDTQLDMRSKAVFELIQSNYTKDDLKTISWNIEDIENPEISVIYNPKGKYISFIRDVSEKYKFLQKRYFLKSSFLTPIYKSCPTLRHRLIRRGETKLNKDGDWESIDTQSFHSLRLRLKVMCYYREYPMGWGYTNHDSSYIGESIPHVKDPPSNFSAMTFFKWIEEKTSGWNIFDTQENGLANSYAIKQGLKWSSGGLVPFVDIINHSASATSFRVRLKDKNVFGHQVETVSAAESYFEQYKHWDEKPNLWHPNWLARLRQWK
ncbi:Tad domain-containing protein [Taylorella equigenitalis]|uniref:Tad domain-containing protein n=1 Tax=Taylorella equigenitalis TaxID=29575 RepID=UPI00237C80FE|nr:Tad domain-containing protein [Taylorella equigenitalis]WDU54248.1 Tad domain-containing protein [Taylorella equigenitalis]